MSIPTEDTIKYALLFLLERQGDGAMHCEDVFHPLAEQFPQLTWYELSVPYSHNRSRWENSVEWAVMRLKAQGLLLHHSVAGRRGIWALSPAGWEWVSRLPSGDELLEEMMRG
jgi:hypothetical protein